MTDKEIIKLINTEAGRHLLGIKDGYPVIKISDNSFHQLVDFRGGRPVIRATFYCRPWIKELFGTIVEKMQIANDEYKFIEDKYEAFLHYSGLEERNYKYPQVFLIQTTFISGAGDGYVRNSGLTWSTVQSASTGTFVDSTSASQTCALTTFLAPNYYIDRGFFPFDTSSLGASADVTAADFKVYSSGKIDNGGSIHLVQTSQASNTTLTTSDFGSVGGTNGATPKTIASVTINSYNTWSLNATGLGFIVKTGFTKLGLRASKDFNNVAPTAQDDINNVSYSEDISSKQPNLIITYTLSAGGAFLFNLL